jgi:hypothetical protein
MAKGFSRLPQIGAVLALQLMPLLAQAGSYSALCSNNNACSVILGNGKISLPGLTLDKEQVLSWAQGGAGSKTDVGMGVGGLILFGLPGLIGFAAKTHDYVFSINYIDADGNAQVASVGFKNNTPANQFMMELMGMTGLSMGEVNKTLQARIEELRQASAEKARLAALDCAPVLKAYGCSYGQYLAANPAVQIWAKKFPQMVPAEKARLRAVD